MKNLIFIALLLVSVNAISQEASSKESYEITGQVKAKFNDVACIVSNKTQRTFFVTCKELQEGYEYDFILIVNKPLKTKRRNAKLVYYGHSSRQATLLKRQVVDSLDLKPITNY